MESSTAARPLSDITNAQTRRLSAIVKPGTSGQSSPTRSGNRIKRCRSSASNSAGARKTSKPLADVKLFLTPKPIWAKDVIAVIGTIPQFLNKRQLKVKIIDFLVKSAEECRKSSVQKFEIQLLKEATIAVFTPRAVAAFSIPPRNYQDFISKVLKYSVWLKQIVDLGVLTKSKSAREKKRYEALKNVVSKLVFLEEQFDPIEGDDFTLINTTAVLKAIAM